MRLPNDDPVIQGCLAKIKEGDLQALWPLCDYLEERNDERLDHLQVQVRLWLSRVSHEIQMAQPGQDKELCITHRLLRYWSLSIMDTTPRDWDYDHPGYAILAMNAGLVRSFFPDAGREGEEQARPAIIGSGQ